MSIDLNEKDVDCLLKMERVISSAEKVCERLSAFRFEEIDNLRKDLEELWKARKKE